MAMTKRFTKKVPLLRKRELRNTRPMPLKLIEGELMPHPVGFFKPKQHVLRKKKNTKLPKRGPKP
jgi:hypothetical protein